MNGTIGKQMVDMPVESASDVQVRAVGVKAVTVLNFFIQMMFLY